MKRISHVLSIISIISLVCACAPFKMGDHRASMCNQLNSQLIFNGGTTITRNAEIQSAETPLTQKAYDTHCTK